MIPFQYVLIVLTVVATRAVESSAVRTMLFLDDHHVLYTAGLKKTLEPLRRTLEDPVLSPTMPWEGLLAYNAVHFVNGTFRMWYQSWTEAHGVVICYAVSTDGISWTKPILNKESNVVLSGDPGLYFGDVLYEPNKGSETFKMILFDRRYVNGVADQVPGMWFAFSADGISWTRPSADSGPALIAAYGGSPVTPPPFLDQDQDNFRSGAIDHQWLTPLGMSDVMNVLYDPPRGTYRVFHKTWIDGIDGNQFWKRAVAWSESETSNFTGTWSRKRHLALYPDASDDPATSYLPGVGNVGTELHGGPVFYHENADAYLMLLEVLDWQSRPSGDLNCELAVARPRRSSSEDETWTRPFRKSPDSVYFFGVNPTPERFDSGTLWMSSSPTTVQNITRFYYGAYSSWDASPSATCATNKSCSGIGVAEMYVDRFASLSPMNASFPAQLTTKVVSFDNVCAITANVDATSLSAASETGEIVVELMDARGYRLRGYDRQNSVPISAGTNDVATSVRWKNASVASLKGEFSIRVLFPAGGIVKLFAISLTDC
eukprot:g1970.t1